MNTLYDNAIESIIVGIEDYQSNSPIRSLSAVRNFYAGVLLLAKHALTQAAPNADLSEILGVKFKPIPDGNGGINHVAVGYQTINFEGLKERLNDFGISINGKQLVDLNRIRNDIEHAYTDANPATVREAIAKAFPVVGDLLRYLNFDPVAVLGDTWEAMLMVKTHYDVELRRCIETFAKIDWPSDILEDAERTCPHCNSHLIAQVDPSNKNAFGMDAACSQCGAQLISSDLIAYILGKHFEYESYSSAKDGIDGPLYTCHECGVDAYVQHDDVNECQWCRTSLGECAMCHEGLTPDTVSSDSSRFCGNCYNTFTKDD